MWEKKGKNIVICVTNPAENLDLEKSRFCFDWFYRMISPEIPEQADMESDCPSQKQLYQTSGKNCSILPGERA